MTTNIIAINKIEQKLLNATIPSESQEVEIYASIARQYAKETHNYSMMVKYTRIYFDARRKTTELVMPYITHGGSSTSHAATLGDFSITRQQWHRRVMELQIEQEKLNEYFDDCISKGWNPSIAGVLKYAEGKHAPDAAPVICTCSHCGNEHRKFIP